MTSYPSGLVTLLFTDIEGSTSTWEAQPELMKTVLARHDEIMRGEIEAAQGYVFKTVGDAFCATFQSAPAALAAAVTIQRALAAEVWPRYSAAGAGARGGWGYSAAGGGTRGGAGAGWQVGHQ